MILTLLKDSGIQGVRPSFLGFQGLMEALRDHTDAGI